MKLLHAIYFIYQIYINFIVKFIKSTTNFGYLCKLKFTEQKNITKYEQKT